MKKLNLSIGGHPLRLDDLKTLQDGLIEAIKGLASSIGISDSGNGFITSGGVVTGASVSSGYMTFNGEMFRIPSHSLVGTGTQYWVISKDTTPSVPLVTAATNASPIVVTTGIDHSLSDGNEITIHDVTGNTAANGIRYVNVLTATTFELFSNRSLSVPVGGSGAYTSGTGIVLITPAIVPSPVTYQNTNVHDVYLDRVVFLVKTTTLPLGGIAGTQVKRFRQLLGITPANGIIMYNGPVSNFTTSGIGNVNTPVEGWGLCDGNGGRPDLKGRFIVGYSSSDPDYNAIGNFGGAKTVTLTSAQSGLPAHTHTTVPHTHSFDTHGGSGGVQQTSGTGFIYTDGSSEPQVGARMRDDILFVDIAAAGVTVNANTTANASQAHENRPPYYTLAYIIKL